MTEIRLEPRYARFSANLSFKLVMGIEFVGNTRIFFESNRKKYAIMKKHGKHAPTRLHANELYLFHPFDKRCPSHGSLWGIFDKHIGQEVFLESYTVDMIEYGRWYKLPDRYRHCRLASRAELKDYMYYLAIYEANSLGLLPDRRSGGRDTGNPKTR